jgi:hypothetical protein
MAQPDGPAHVDAEGLARSRPLAIDYRFVTIS